MPQRFLDQQLPLAQIDTAKRDVPPENYCNSSLYICDNIYSGLPCEPHTSASPRSCGLLSASGLGTESRPQDVPNLLPGSLSGGMLGNRGAGEHHGAAGPPTEVPRRCQLDGLQCGPHPRHD